MNIYTEYSCCEKWYTCMLVITVCKNVLVQHWTEKFLKCDVYPSRSSAEKATWLLVWRTTGPCLNTLSE